MDTVDEVLYNEQVQREEAEDRYWKELDELIEQLFIANCRLRFLYNKWNSDTRIAIREAISSTYEFFTIN